MKRILWLAAMLYGALAVAGCDAFQPAGGWVKETLPDGTTREAHAFPNSDAPALIAVTGATSQPSSSLSSGSISPAAQKIQGEAQALLAGVKAKAWAGFALILLGGAAIGLRTLIPPLAAISVTGCLAIIGVGVLLLILPQLDSLTMLAIMAAAGGLFLFGTLRNHKEQNT